MFTVGRQKNIAERQEVQAVWGLTAIIGCGCHSNVGHIGWVHQVIHLDTVGGVSVDIQAAGLAVGGLVSRLPVGTVLASSALGGVAVGGLEARRSHCRGAKR